MAKELIICLRVIKDDTKKELEFNMTKDSKISVEQAKEILKDGVDKIPLPKKKVFRVWKYLEDFDSLGWHKDAIKSVKGGWPLKADGLTKTEAFDKYGLVIDNDWLVEEDG